jgi:hypothetical protein
VDDVAFLFQRNPNRTPEDFVEHYLTVHSRMGREFVTGFTRYAVSLRDLDQELLAGRPVGPATIPVDALTEHSGIPSDVLFDTTRAFSNPEQAAELMADHASMFGEQQHCYSVERRVVVGGEQDWPSQQRTPGVKLLTLLTLDDVTRPGALAEPGEPYVWRSATSHVLDVVSAGAPVLAALVERQFQRIEDVERFLADAAAGTVPAESFLLSEYIQIP